MTGGAVGIGGATSRRLAEEGATVLVADLNLDAAEATVARIREGGSARVARGPGGLGRIGSRIGGGLGGSGRLFGVIGFDRFGRHGGGRLGGFGGPARGIGGGARGLRRSSGVARRRVDHRRVDGGRPRRGRRLDGSPGLSYTVPMTRISRGPRPIVHLRAHVNAGRARARSGKNVKDRARSCLFLPVLVRSCPFLPVPASQCKPLTAHDPR